MTDRTITLQAELVERLESLADVQGRTMDEVLGDLLQQYAPRAQGNWVLAVARGMEAADIDWIDDPDASANSRETETSMNELEHQFHEAMIQVYKNAKLHCAYNATYFLQMVNERGGLAAARYLISTDVPSEGFTKLWECKRLDLTVEAVALNPIYRELFTEEELKLAKERLEQYGYEIP